MKPTTFSLVVTSSIGPNQDFWCLHCSRRWLWHLFFNPKGLTFKNWSLKYKNVRTKCVLMYFLTHYNVVHTFPRSIYIYIAYIPKYIHARSEYSFNIGTKQLQTIFGWCSVSYVDAKVCKMSLFQKVELKFSNIALSNMVSHLQYSHLVFENKP